LYGLSLGRPARATSQRGRPAIGGGSLQATGGRNQRAIAIAPVLYQHNAQGVDSRGEPALRSK